MPLNKTVGKPCGRPSCEHGIGLHDDEGCTFCDCGYFLHASLMEEVAGVEMWRNRIGGYRQEQASLYGWLRVFEGYSHAEALGLLNHGDKKALTKRKPSRQKRLEMVVERLVAETP